MLPDSLWVCSEVVVWFSGCADLQLRGGAGMTILCRRQFKHDTHLSQENNSKGYKYRPLSNFLTFPSVSSIFLSSLSPEKKNKLVSNAKTKVKPGGLTLGSARRLSRATIRTDYRTGYPSRPKQKTDGLGAREYRGHFHLKKFL